MWKKKHQRVYSIMHLFIIMYLKHFIASMISTCYSPHRNCVWGAVAIGNFRNLDFSSHFNLFTIVENIFPRKIFFLRYRKLP